MGGGPPRPSRSSHPPAASTGRSTSTVVPDGSAAETRTVPRSAATRSRMFANPPLVVDAGDTAPMPRPSSVIEILQMAVLTRQPDRGSGRVRMLRGVRQRLANHVVRGRLDLVREPLGAHRGIRLDRERNRIPRDARLDGRDEAVVGEHRRVDAVRELAQVGQRLAGLVLQLRELLGRELAALQPVARKPESRDLRDDVCWMPSCRSRSSRRRSSSCAATSRRGKRSAARAARRAAR